MRAAYLTQIKFAHYGPKDKDEGIKTYAIVDDATEIWRKVDSEYQYGQWASRDRDGETCELYGDDGYTPIGTETHTERMIRLRGDIHDEDLEIEDAYYGVTTTGWSEPTPINVVDAATLIRLGVAVDWRDS
jgi:hypothetical protein